MTMVIAAAGFNYGPGLIGWIIIGLIAGALAGIVMRGGGYGLVGDLIVGVIGALIGGFILSLFGLGANGFWGTLVTAFIGACILLALLRAVGGTRIGAGPRTRRVIGTRPWRRGEGMDPWRAKRAREERGAAGRRLRA